MNAFALLAEFDRLDYARGVLDDDDAMVKLVEEILRFGTPFPMKPLFVRRDSQFGELNVPAESVLTIWFAAANRDEAVNGGVAQADPSVFDPQRSPNKHFALGWAKHHCLGAELARVETRILIEEALRRLPGYGWTRPGRSGAMPVSSTASPRLISPSSRSRPSGSCRRAA